MQNEPTVVEVRGPVAALRLYRDLSYSVFSYAGQYIGARFQWTWKKKNPQFS